MKLKKVIAFVLAAVMLCTVMVFTASAETGNFREEQLKKFEDMKHRSIHANISNGGFFNLKSSKFYTRQVTGVDSEGNFILSGWKCVYSESDVGNCTDEITLPGTCVAFAYSVDITWGTDFPYSGIFWNKINQPVSDIGITMYGGCRNVRVAIDVDEKSVVDNRNCSSHKEWTP